MIATLFAAAVLAGVPPCCPDDCLVPKPTGEWFIPATVGHMEASYIGTGIGYTFPETKIQVMLQGLVGHFDGEDFTETVKMPYGGSRVVEFNSPSETKYGWQVTVVFPLGAK